MSNDDTDDKKREAEVAKNIQVAIVYGANELAKTAATLGEKVWWRMVREDALTRYHELGGVGEPEHGVTILRLEYPQTIAFTANDIDLMRKCVAEHDAKKASKMVKNGGDLTAEEIAIACRNIGFDITCGACAGLFYTGKTFGEHSCKPTLQLVADGNDRYSIRIPSSFYFEAFEKGDGVLFLWLKEKP